MQLVGADDEDDDDDDDDDDEEDTNDSPSNCSDDTGSSDCIFLSEVGKT
jgi:hypothetical protein